MFMAVMVFINGVKLFHSHHDSDNSSSHSAISSFAVNSCFSLHQISQDKHCPICDFNLMKDADMAHSDIPHFIRISGNAVFSCPLPHTLQQFSIPGKDRAPPFFLS
jgi:hypothetical protein